MNKFMKVTTNYILSKLKKSTKANCNALQKESEKTWQLPLCPRAFGAPG